MTTLKKLDKILELARVRAQEEVGSLMGVDFKLSDFSNKLVAKGEYFEDLSGKKIVAKVDISGEIEGGGCIVVDVKDAIRLGGTLIMLPKVELEEVVKNEEYSEEAEDSYGEIANIISGSFTKIFEENYSKSLRFIRKEQKLISPHKVDGESDDPIPRQWYYRVRARMSMAERSMGDLDLLIPAEPFEIEIPGKPVEAAEEILTAETITEETQQPQPLQQSSNEVQQQKGPPPGPSVDIKKQQKLVDKLLDSCRGIISQEVGALLGVDVKLTKLQNRIISKEEFFQEEAVGRQVLAHMEMVDGVTGESFLFTSLKDAIRIGSILIMLPPTELENAVGEEEFSVDVEDAYGEIANIISGVLTSVFKDQYPESIRFIKSKLEVVTPVKVDCSNDDVIPDQLYYLSSSNLQLDDRKVGNMAFLFPADLLKLEQLYDSSVSQGSDASASREPHAIPLGSAKTADDIPRQPIPGGGSEDAEVLIIEDNREEANKIEEELLKIEVVSKRISFTDNINFHLKPGIKLVFIVMREVNEQAYGIAIKVSSLSRAPIVAAGCNWTRSKVIKAVKYGVNDILLTPASGNDIREKVEGNLVKLAA